MRLVSGFASSSCASSNINERPSSKLTNPAATICSIFVVSLASIWWWKVFSPHRLDDDNDNDNDGTSINNNNRNDSEHDDEDKSTIFGEAVVQSFPWDPQITTNLSTNDESSTTPTNDVSIKNNKHDTSEQLKFLASMTFANGGIRPPSCPCCI